MTDEPPENLGAAEAALPRHYSDEQAAASAVPTVHTSSAAVELRRLKPVARRMLKLSDEVLDVFDAIMAWAKRLAGDGEDRPTMDGLLGAIEEVSDDAVERFSQAAASFSEEDLGRLISFYSRPEYQRYVRRMVGEGAMERLRKGLSEDLDVLIGLIFRGADVVLPYAVAFENLTGALTEKQVREFLDFYPASGSMLRFAFDIFDAIDLMADKVLMPEAMKVLEEARTHRLASRDVEELTRQMREQISGHSRELVEQVSASLTRKLRGAKDALAHSADSTSQAASSLTEFLDRLFRNSFPNDQVLAWIEANCPNERDLTFVRQGKVLPTKRGQALCFLYGGQPVQELSPLHNMAAKAIKVVRDELEQLKHGDDGTEEERKRIEDCLTVVEGFIGFGCKLAWMGLSDEALRDLRARLDPPPKGQTSAGELVDGGAA